MSNDTMKDIVKRIKSRRNELEYSFQDLANLTNLSKSTLQRYEAGGIKNIPLDKLKILAKALTVSPEWIMGWEETTSSPQTHPDILPLTTRKIPLLGEIACGEPILANREYELYEEISETLDADFCVQAKGDSMIGARIHDGDIVFIKEVPEVYNGEIAAVVIEDSVTLKRVYYNNDNEQLILQAENNQYAPQVYVGDDLEKVKVLGRAVGFQSKII